MRVVEAITAAAAASVAVKAAAVAAVAAMAAAMAAVRSLLGWKRCLLQRVQVKNTRRTFKRKSWAIASQQTPESTPASNQFNINKNNLDYLPACM